MSFNDDGCTCCDYCQRCPETIRQFFARLGGPRLVNKGYRDEATVYLVRKFEMDQLRMALNGPLPDVAPEPPSKSLATLKRLRDRVDIGVPLAGHDGVFRVADDVTELLDIVETLVRRAELLTKDGESITVPTGESVDGVV